jgi:hypothetical protein
MSSHNLPFDIEGADFKAPFRAKLETEDGFQYFFAILEDVPANTTAGYAVGATVVDVGETPGIFVNIGTVASATFVQQNAVIASAAQAAVATSALTVSGTYNQAEVTAIITRLAAAVVLVNRLRTDLIAAGIIKGAA